MAKKKKLLLPLKRLLLKRLLLRLRLLKLRLPLLKRLLLKLLLPLPTLLLPLPTLLLLRLLRLLPLPINSGFGNEKTGLRAGFFTPVASVPVARSPRSVAARAGYRQSGGALPHDVCRNRCRG